MNILPKAKKGFTLIEVVLAIAVGLIIIAGVSVGYTYAKRAAITDNQRKDVALITQPAAATPTNTASNSSTSRSSPATAPVTATTTKRAPVNSSVSYKYECDEHVAFTVTPGPASSSLRVAASSEGAYPSTSTLLKESTSAGIRYVGNGVILTPHGTTLILGEGDSALNCSAVPGTTGSFDFTKWQ